MKALRIISILALLVLFPAISYLYLIKGFNFRMDALKDLEPKEQLEAFDYPNVSLNDLKGKATLIFDGHNMKAKSLLEPVYDEFSHREEFQMIGFVADSAALRLYKNTKQWMTLLGDFPYEKEIALIDTGGVIRNFYDLDSISFKALIQHIPIIIPREKEQDIVLKREDEK
ncbi:hypothetical protein [Portibacter lacus]|uniref:Uncharacterized protein n=1 Tax=Portibacter lacus TaxID=1099794 RepID=A0AA37WF93_9BACT|nr:hypothetical protein [Portibacter lacus]GLR19706.1 hypothetical protein GCM10007940_43220 [Portibacter lacus]